MGALALEDLKEGVVALQELREKEEAAADMGVSVESCRTKTERE